jgi:SH3-like domain-containing protein
MRSRAGHAWFAAALLAAVPVEAVAEFRSVAENAAILYDAPSARATKLYVLGRSYPVEVIVVVEGWTKIRDAGGELAWIETKSLSEQRTVMVKARRGDIRQAADDKAPLAFQAEQNVLLDLNEVTGSGWARVTHRDGQSGYIRLSQIWGV